MLSRLSAKWQTALKRNLDSGLRFYINPRGREYFPLAGTPVYAAAPTGHATTGSFTLNGGTLDYQLDMSFPLAVHFRARVKTTSTGAMLIFSPSPGSTTKRLQIGTTDSSGIKWRAILDESSPETITSSANVLTTEWADIVFTVDDGGLFPSETLYPSLSLYPQGRVSKLYLNGVEVASGYLSDIRTNKTALTIDATNYEIDFVKIYVGHCATAESVSDYFRSSYSPCVHFDFNKRAIGQELCNVSKYVRQYTHSRASNAVAANMSLSLQNVSGEFSADQYATFAPELGSYNGTVAERFLTRKVGVYAEAWAADRETTEPLFEPIFNGWAMPGAFGRSTDWGDASNVSIQADDAMADIAMRIIRLPRKWEGFNLFASSGTSSLFHEVAQLTTRREVYNYLTNSGFENATIGNSWTGPIERSTGQVYNGTYSGRTTAAGTITQGVDIGLSNTERFTFSIAIYSSSNSSMTIRLAEKLGAAPVANTSQTVNHSGMGWQMFAITHEVTNNTSNRLSCELDLPVNVLVDNGMLVYGDYKPVFVLNSADGVAGISQSSQAALASFDFAGIDVDSVSITHPWALIKEGDKVHDVLRELCDASLARYMIVTPDGVLKVRSNYVAYSNAPETILTDIGSLAMSQYEYVANKLKVSGVYINKKEKPELVWTLKASSLGEDSGHTGDNFKRTVGAGQLFPLAAEAPDGVECKYGEESSPEADTSLPSMARRNQ